MISEIELQDWSTTLRELLRWLEPEQQENTNLVNAITRRTARAMLNKLRRADVIELTPGTGRRYELQGFSPPKSQTYVVTIPDVDPKYWSCDCPDGQTAPSVYCKHIIAIYHLKTKGEL